MALCLHLTGQSESHDCTYDYRVQYVLLWDIPRQTVHYYREGSGYTAKEKIWSSREVSECLVKSTKLFLAISKLDILCTNVSHPYFPLNFNDFSFHFSLQNPSLVSMISCDKVAVFLVLYSGLGFYYGHS